jgi:hypothetical protein
MQTKITRHFLDSAVALFAAIAAAQIICNIATAGLTQPHDPIFQISLRQLFWIAGGLELLCVLALLTFQNARLKVAIVLWFVMNLAIYWVAMQTQGGHGVRGYLGGLAHTFGVSSAFTDATLKIIFLYLLSGGIGLLLWNWFKPEEIPLKALCVFCGGHIAFDGKNLGQKTPCPNCRKETTLRPPGNLKMSCFFCHEHIEFPSYAIGEKMPCPHCKMGISLKEPA